MRVELTPEHYRVQQDGQHVARMAESPSDLFEQVPHSLDRPGLDQHPTLRPRGSYDLVFLGGLLASRGRLTRPQLASVFADLRWLGFRASEIGVLDHGNRRLPLGAVKGGSKDNSLARIVG
jgi:hypothetical protein